MTLIAQAQNLIAFFVALELLSIPLYVLCASARRTERSLESGLKYLIIGSIGSATVLYGFALLYGGSGSTDFAGIAQGLGRRQRQRHPRPDRHGDGRHRARLQDLDWRPSTSGRPTSTRARRPRSPPSWRWRPRPPPSSRSAGFFEVALGPIAHDWKPALAALAVASIAIGNIGALGQDSLKRLMGYSGIAQAGYMLGRGRRRHGDRARGARLLPRRLHLDEPRGLRGGGRPRAGDRSRRRHRRRRRHRPLPALARLAAHDRDARPGRAARRPRVSWASSS